MADADTDIRQSFLRRAGLEKPTVSDVVNAIKAIPHGRPRERSAAGVVEDWRGTCSTKLLLLRQVCPDLRLRFFNRVFRLTPGAAKAYLGPEAASVIPPEGMIDVHTYARVLMGDAWVLIDLAFPGESWDGSSNMTVPWAEGEDFEAGDDPIVHKETLVGRFGDPQVRARLIEVISR
jgi:hypothetical protein